MRDPARIALRILLLAALALAGCGPADERPRPGIAHDPAPPMRIGTLPVEDALPLWAAEQRGDFETVGLEGVEIVLFDSEAARNAAFEAGEVDAVVADLVTAVRFEASGTPVTVPLVMLGVTPAEGRFGLVAAPGSKVASLGALGVVRVAVPACSVEACVLDGLLRQARVATGTVAAGDAGATAERVTRLLAGQIGATVLAEPHLSLALSGGATLLADDTAGENLSQGVLVVSDAYMKAGGVDTVQALMDAWDLAAYAVGRDPGAFKGLLAEKTGLREAVSAPGYEPPSYPIGSAPKEPQVRAILGWMRARGLVASDAVTYESLVIVTP